MRRGRGGSDQSRALHIRPRRRKLCCQDTSQSTSSECMTAFRSAASSVVVLAAWLECSVSEHRCTLGAGKNRSVPYFRRFKDLQKPRQARLSPGPCNAVRGGEREVSVGVVDSHAGGNNRPDFGQRPHYVQTTTLNGGHTCGCWKVHVHMQRALARHIRSLSQGLLRKTSRLHSRIDLTPACSTVLLWNVLA